MTRRIVLAAIVLLAGCSSGKSSAPTTGPTTATVTTTTAAPVTTAATTTPAPTTVATAVPTTIAPTTTAAPTTTTASPSTTAAATPIEAAMQSLLSRYDAAVAAILADPRVAKDQADPKVVAYLSLFPKGSTFALGTLDSWVEEGSNGRFYRPGPLGWILKSTLRQVTSSSATEATFTSCTSQSFVVVDSGGNRIEGQGGVSGGSIVAVNDGSGWLFRDLTRTSGEGCPKPGNTG